MGSNKCLIARVSRFGLPDSSEGWVKSKMLGEQALLQHLKNTTSIHVPAVFCLSSISALSGGLPVKLPFLLMEKVKGTEITAAYERLSFTQKVCRPLDVILSV